GTLAWDPGVAGPQLVGRAGGAGGPRRNQREVDDDALRRLTGLPHRACLLPCLRCRAVGAVARSRACPASSTIAARLAAGPPERSTGYSMIEMSVCTIRRGSGVSPRRWAG